ncbi:MAG: F0F1 ATP synthase subunit epsilon [Dehalococcoidia bacterium]|nr:F0F1 ATP synthase subunit epsilon [Dehalococcoidia bacterium]
MAKIKLEIVTAERLVYSEEVDEIVAPGVGGELGIMPQHAPLMTILMPGMITVKKGSDELNMAVSGGFIEVRPERVIVLADAAERAEEIDIARAEEARRRAEEAKVGATAAGAEAQMAAEAALARALARLKVAQRRRREKPI